MLFNDALRYWIQAYVAPAMRIARGWNSDGMTMVGKHQSIETKTSTSACVCVYVCVCVCVCVCVSSTNPDWDVFFLRVNRIRTENWNL